MSPTTLSLLKWGADFGPLTLTGDWWRVITCNFVHIGIAHIAMNMYAFIFIGMLLEQLIGSRRMFIAYLLTGICSAAFSLSLHPETVSAGASGSIFGLYGIFLAFLLFHKQARRQRKALLTSIIIFVGFNLVYGMKSGIDNAAHLGGLISGFILGLIYVASFRFEKPAKQRTISIIGELVIFSAFLFSFLGLCKDTPAEYQEIRQEWDRGITEADLNAQSKTETDEDSRATFSSEYEPITNNTKWISFFDSPANFSCQYPITWTKIPSIRFTEQNMMPPIFMIVNGNNQFVVRVVEYKNKEAFDSSKEMSLEIPKDDKGNTAEGFTQSKVTINELPMMKTTHLQQIESSESDVQREVQQTVYFYYQENSLRIYSIVTLVYDSEANEEINKILSTIEIK